MKNFENNLLTTKDYINDLEELNNNEEILNYFLKLKEFWDEQEILSLEKRYESWIKEKEQEKKENSNKEKSSFHQYLKEKRIQEQRKKKKIWESVRSKDIFERYLRMVWGVKVDLKKEYDFGEEIFSFNYIDSEIENLPDGYYYKGGMARIALEKSLGINVIREARDIDLAVEESKNDEELSNRLAQHYSPDDFENGYGVEILESNYFESRDFTINEVLYTGNKIIFSKQCLLDTLRGVLRITDFEKEERYWDEGDYYINPKLLAKTVRFLAETSIYNNEKEFINHKAIEWIGIDEFHMALHLDRAIGIGRDVANRYISILKEYDLLPMEINEYEEAVSYLNQFLYNFFFRNYDPEERNRDEAEEEFYRMCQEIEDELSK